MTTQRKQFKTFEHAEFSAFMRFSAFWDELYADPYIRELQERRRQIRGKQVHYFHMMRKRGRRRP